MGAKRGPEIVAIPNPALRGNEGTIHSVDSIHASAELLMDVGVVVLEGAVTDSGVAKEGS